MSSNATSSKFNFTAEDESITESIIPPITQCVVGFVGNILALLTLKFSSKSHKWKPFYRFVCGLMISDLSGIVTVYPLTLTRYISNFTFEFPIELCRFVSFMLSFVFMSSASNVCAMSFDRFIAIVFPLNYGTLSKGSRINLTLLGIWIFTAILCSLNLFGLGNVKSYYPGSWCFMDFQSSDIKNRANAFIYACVGIVILIATVCTNAIVIVYMCRRYACNKINPVNAKNGTGFIIVYLFVVVTLFSICWTPLMVRMLIEASYDNPENAPIDLLAVRLSTTNVLIDPWIFLLLRKRNFELIGRFCKSLRQKTETRITEPQRDIRRENSTSLDFSVEIDLSTGE